nr:phospholipase-like protein [Tanacetum cinerariifolium]
MFDLYDVKISVRSSVKLLPEIKGLSSMKPNCEKLFRGTIFGPWLDIQSHKNDSHMMHYAFQDQVLYNNALRGLLGKLSGKGKLDMDFGELPPTVKNGGLKRVVEKICPKMNRMSVDDGDGVLDSQTKYVIEEASMLPTMSSNSSQAGNVALSKFDALKKEVLLIMKCKYDEFDELKKNIFKASSSSAHPGNKEHVSHLDDNMEIDENPSIDSILVVPPKVDDPMLRTIKPKDDFDEADVDSYDDEYMSLFNDEEQPAKSSLNNLELQQEPDIVDVKDRILEQQANADKGKTTIIQETVEVTDLSLSTPF